jgi:AcrR family transcriptional regulator
MSRPRVIETDQILNAAEAVVVRDGAGSLTLDAVAREAGISKASVIYDYGSKQALIKAVIERRAQDERHRLQSAVRDMGSCKDALVLGHIALAESAMPDEMQAAGVSLCAALSQDAESRAVMQELVGQDIAAIRATSGQPRTAMLAYLAVEGLRLLEFLGLHSWEEAERQEILADIRMLVTPCAPATAPPRSSG